MRVLSHCSLLISHYIQPYMHSLKKIFLEVIIGAQEFAPVYNEGPCTLPPASPDGNGLCNYSAI